MKFDLPQDILIQSIEHSNLAHTISRADGDMELIYVNQAFLNETGYERDEAIGRNCRFLQGEDTNPHSLDKIRTALKNQKPLDIELLNYKKDGTPFWNRLRIAPIYNEEEHVVAFIGIQSDITGILDAQRIEAERQKLEALGRMTCNISHEIKNTLQPVKLMADTLKDWENLSEEQIERCIEILRDNVQLADHIIQDVLQFSKKPTIGNESIKLDDLKNIVISFVKKLLHSRIDFVVQIKDETETDQCVELNINNLHQVLMNIVNNALQAMNNRGKITLHWRTEKLTAQNAHNLDLNEGAYLCIDIEDTGSGIDDKIMNAIFDPFFSTKPPGEGAGLGLPISCRIVKEWNGTVHVSSEINQGSVFTIYLPLST